MSLGRLVELLDRLNLDPTDEDILDLLWLAHRLQPAAPEQPIARTRSPAPAAPPTAEITQHELDRQREEHTIPRKPQPGSVPARTATDDPSHTLHLPGVARQASRQAAAVRAPAVSALGDQLEFARTLRPLKRRVPSRFLREVDEEATVGRIADEGVWIPVLRPAPARWLELAVVVDGYESMTIWRQLVSELRSMLERLGAFSDIRFWVLDGGTGESDPLGVRRWQPRSPLRSTGELADPTGRRAIIVVSDCIGPLWRRGAAQRQLAGWGVTQPVAIMQPLAQRLWSYTHARPIPVELRAVHAGAPNAQLVVASAAHGARLERGRVPVPILELEPDWLASWSRLITASGISGIPMMALFADPAAKQREGRMARSAPTDDASLLVQRFRASASPEAFQLAVYLTAAPISLPVIRLIQHSMLGTSDRSQVAEVFLGGLLKHMDGDLETDPEAVRYEFINDGVRNILFRRLRRADALDMLLKVSAELDVRFGHGHDFRALLVGRNVVGHYLVGPDSRPFAVVAERVLRLLGGQYLLPADRLATALGYQEHAATARVSSPAPRGRPPQRRSAVSPLVCPYCYHAFAGREILFRCNGRAGVDGPPCRPRRDEVLEQRMGQSASILPPVFGSAKEADEAVCPWCHEPTRIQVCPRCHSRLPATFRSVEGRMIALAGPSLAGKTAFMTVLIHELRHRAGDRLSASTIGADAWTHERFVRDYESRLYRRSLLFDRTTTVGQDNIQPLVFRFTMDQRTGLWRRPKELLLSFTDGAGEDLINAGKVDLMTRYLGAADGVITLIDPLQLPAVREELPAGMLPPLLPPDQIWAFERITGLLLECSDGPVIDKPVAIVLTKLDALWDLLPEDSVLRASARVSPVFDASDSAAIQEQITGLLVRWGIGRLTEIASQSYSRSRFFAVSSLGAPPTQSNQVAPQGIQPYRVTDPFIWLLNQFQFVATMQ
ncbi:MAG TPA: SAV_2336 N-terminal domain-related protein [Streptosporangiaceae bacterium]